jgi:hypothetical protein
MLIGLSAALYAAAKAEDPRVEVKLSAREATIVAGAISFVMCALYVVARLHRK